VAVLPHCRNISVVEDGASSAATRCVNNEFSYEFTGVAQAQHFERRRLAAIAAKLPSNPSASGAPSQALCPT
jgi:hypothetical protein